MVSLCGMQTVVFDLINPFGADVEVLATLLGSESAVVAGASSPRQPLLSKLQRRVHGSPSARNHRAVFPPYFPRLYDYLARVYCCDSPMERVSAAVAHLKELEVLPLEALLLALPHVSCLIDGTGYWVCTSGGESDGLSIPASPTSAPTPSPSGGKAAAALVVGQHWRARCLALKLWQSMAVAVGPVATSTRLLPLLAQCYSDADRAVEDVVRAEAVFF